MMELEVQKYLRGGKTLDDLATEYGIEVKVDEGLGVALLNYNMIASDITLDIVRECRALILETQTWDVVSRSFKRFANWNEPAADAIDWSTAVVQEKLDGSLVTVWHHKGEWRISTRGSIDASGSVGDHNLTFAELIRLTAAETHRHWMGWHIGMSDITEELTANLRPERCYSFELTAPENQVVCFYLERRLTFLAAWDKTTLEEVDADGDIPYWVPRIGHHPAPKDASLEDVIRFAEDRDPFEHEGCVVVDANRNRVKVKSPEYVLINKTVQSLTTRKQRLELILQGKDDDLAGYITPAMAEDFKAIKEGVKAMAQQIEGLYATVKDLPTQKDFALAVKDGPFNWALFQMRKTGKPALEVLCEQWNGGTPRHLDKVWEHINGKE